MVVYMVLTEAVVARTFRAVTELEMWILCVGPAADGTFMPVRGIRLLLFCFSRLLPEVRGGFRVLHFVEADISLYCVSQISIAENQVVQYWNQREEVQWERI